MNEQEALAKFGRSLVATAASEDFKQSLEDVGIHLYGVSRWTLASVLHPVATFKSVMLIGNQETINANVERALSFPKLPARTDQVLTTLNRELTLANGCSAARPLLVVAANTVGIHNPWEYVALMAAAFATDALDGWVARKKGASPYGSFVDITADRTAESLMYLYLAGEGLIPGWIPAVTIGRGVVTDVIRASHMIIDRDLPSPKNSLSPNEHPLSELVTSRPLRAGYATVKAAVGITAPFLPQATEVLAETAAAICIVRGVPVVFNRSNERIMAALKNTVKNA